MYACVRLLGLDILNGCGRLVNASKGNSEPAQFPQMCVATSIVGRASNRYVLAVF